MAKISLIFAKIKASPLYSHFSAELLLLLVLTFTVGVNLFLRTGLWANPAHPNQSLFYSYLKKHPELNEKLVEVLESVNVKLAEHPDLSKQILAASTKEETASSQTQSVSLPTLNGSTLLKPNPASSDGISLRRDKEIYTVRGGDTVARIALAYGVTERTIIDENDLSLTGLIQPGQELKILPTSGISHVIQKDETISGIAKKYGVDPEDIFEYNGIEAEELIFPGDEIIIPNAVEKSPLTPERSQYLANLQREDVKKAEIPNDFMGSGGELLWPLPGAYRISQGFSRRHPAIDIPCRDCSVLAATDGIVELSGWQKGYGYTIVINHGAGLKTRYAHAKELLVSAGQQVASGQVIMISGSTGRSSGPHLHFETIKNGGFVNPLELTKR
jgi:murein DD-endopeptidase MepM/ murein hydrolase activator NlpD